MQAILLPQIFPSQHSAGGTAHHVLPPHIIETSSCSIRDLMFELLCHQVMIAVVPEVVGPGVALEWPWDNWRWVWLPLRCWPWYGPGFVFEIVGHGGVPWVFGIGVVAFEVVCPGMALGCL